MVKYISFYLPQFHPIEENNRWWGDGFTEWTNVTKASPLYPGHQQPRLPNGLGFYDVRVPETRNAQFELAAAHGIDAFCYYYYWFNGKRLLNRPLDDVMAGRVNPFPFCICWANESWSRRWDGQENDVLIAQEHSLESDINFINDVLPILSSKHYVRVDGKPILLIYRADRLVDPRLTTEAWQKEAKKAGLPGLHLAAVQSFGFSDVINAGFDSAVEFPPHFLTHYGRMPTNIANSMPFYEEFKGNVYSYHEVVEHALSRPEEPYLLHRGVMCAWDNTARRKSAATIFHKPSPFLYEKWLTEVTRQAQLRTTEPLVFINAWNEWAEGSTLEPCTSYGKSFLMATARSKQAARALVTLPKLVAPQGNMFPAYDHTKEPVVLLGHDAERNGAQINLLHFAKVLKSQGVPLTILLLGGGPLLDAYKAVAPTFVENYNFASSPKCSQFFRELSERGYRRAITNTVVTGSVIKAMKDEDYVVVSLIHELPEIIRRHNLQDRYGAITIYADAVVFASSFVRDRLDVLAPTPSNKVIIRPQGCYRRISDDERLQVSRIYWDRLGIPKGAKVVVGAGYGDTRKGMDLFASISQQTYLADETVHFVWIGDIETQMKELITAQMRNECWQGNLHLNSFSADISQMLMAADLFLLTSREDPFPTVVLEALDAGIPVIAFEGASGIQELESTGFIKLVDYLNVSSMQAAMLDALKDVEFLDNVRQEAPTYIARNFDYSSYVNEINILANPAYRNSNCTALSEHIRVVDYKIDVVIPNYNSAPYTKERLSTIHYQSVRPTNVVVLDDASSDDSLSYIKNYVESHELDWKIITSQQNSGSPFAQWRRGVYNCESDLIWIAESDDACRLDFLEKVVPTFDDPEVVLAYSHSMPVGINTEPLDFNYDQYLSEVDPHLWKRSFKMDGKVFSGEYLTSLNTIPNVSAVIFRREAALQVLEKVEKFKACGDWLFYYLISQYGKIAFIPEILNYHRRHASSVITKTEKNQIYVGELLQLAKIILSNGQYIGSLGKRKDLVDRIESEYRRHKAAGMPNDIRRDITFAALFENVANLAERKHDAV